MLPIAFWSKVGIVCGAILLAGSSLAGGSVASAESPKSASCAAPAYRQFDFWAGDWDVVDVGSPAKVAHVRVDLILDGCVLREDYQGADGHKGQSFTIYDAARNIWHQSWVTNRGQLLEIEGKIEAGEMVLSGEDHAAGALVRGTWKPVNGEVRETAVTSTDAGKTWKPWFDLMFRPASAADNTGGPFSGDRKTVAALDTQYQVAVKKNDADGMAAILADNFTLVTGSGKVYSKADLLEEARSGRMQYERQDDSDQNVRVWGDTAVITAKLVEKGTDGGKPFEYTVWFSDTYVRTPNGWRYVFGQSSLPLPTPAR
ncbi:MAG: nuclear transport factor 2 family protein [Acidobacteriia bacterium]|nr:nuclear transport factor 2 family protein [Terriglobia bacterium]